MAAAQRGSRKILFFVSWRGYIYYTRLLYGGGVPGCHVLLGGHLMSFCRRYSKKKGKRDDHVSTRGPRSYTHNAQIL